MKICFVLQDTGRIYGAQRATLDLIEGLQLSGACEAHVLLFQENRAAGAAEQYQSALADTAASLTRVLVDQAYSRTLIAAIRAAMERLQADVLHSVGYKADLHAGKAADFGKRWPLVSTVHGWFFLPDFKERLYYRINLWTLKRFQRVIVLSRYYEQHLVDHGFSAGSLRRIPSGFRTREKGPLAPPSIQYQAGVLSRFTGEKNLSLFLDALKIVHAARPQDRFLLAGEGPQKNNLERFRRGCSLDQVVEMPGFVDRDTFFQQVQVYVNCSTIENLPYTVLEAMEASLPVVVTRVGGMPDLVEHEKTGLLVEPRQPEALAEALIQLLEDRTTRRTYGQAGREKLEQEFSPEHAVASHLELYGELL
ncbi:MAG: glycosyltransferase involved in cell wall biosynthesis [Kiritimatiellia bacterium]|jgi:glycosyltransferase involved in cell wall biosynthesis